ncbi:transcriptional regulator [Novosphingobium malaysiense]|uniref:Transcriptional regulator n=1 Tax=Novosphingobium malaysiense TaxID=1348853 RepID=A0A0B1ZUE7_9SPHN|nr:transcriptional regulator [Novosphingobium malaysiense]
MSHSSDHHAGSTAKDARALRSSAALREGLLSLLEHKAFDQITIRDICAKAGVHYATFFRHYPSKEALLDGLAAQQIETLVDLTLPIKDEVGDRASFDALCDYVQQHRALWSVLFNGGAGATMRAEWLRRARIVAETHDPVSDWLPKELGTICSTSLIAETISWWLAQPDGTHSPGEIAGILDRLIGASTLAQ